MSGRPGIHTGTEWYKVIAVGMLTAHFIALFAAAYVVYVYAN